MTDSYLKKYIKRKDDPDAPENRAPRTSPNKKYKDTKKWCKGKVGRPHQHKRVTILSNYFSYSTTNSYSYDRCEVCGKRSNYEFSKVLSNQDHSQ